MTYTDHRSQARSYSATAAAATKRAEREAQRSADAYRSATQMARQAEQLTRSPRLWDASYNPAELEARSRSWASIGDTYLRSSFRATESAAFYAGLAASYRDMAKRYDYPIMVSV